MVGSNHSYTQHRYIQQITLEIERYADDYRQGRETVNEAYMICSNIKSTLLDIGDCLSRKKNSKEGDFVPYD